VFLDASHGGPHWIRIARPAWDAGEGFPLLVALHGLGEARKGREPGSWGWIKDYHLDQAMLRLRKGKLTPADLQGFSDPKRLARINKSLRRRPFRGIVVACPYTPDLISQRSLDNAASFAAFLVDRVVPEAQRLPGVSASASSIGIDGVSLGGRLALLSALAHPQRFAAVGAIQAAIDGDEVAELARRAGIAWGHGTAPRLRFLSSDKDFYREAVLSLHSALQKVHVPHDYTVVPGPHAYAFNRGPGAIEMLLWHDRVLRGEAPL